MAILPTPPPPAVLATAASILRRPGALPADASPDVLDDVRAYLDRRGAEVSRVLLLIRLAFAGVLLGYLAVDALTATAASPAALGLVLAYGTAHLAASMALRRTTTANAVYVAIDIAFVLVLRHFFLFEALVDPNATMVGLFSLLLVAYVTYGDPRLLAGAAAAMIVATLATIGGEALLATSFDPQRDLRLHPLRVMLALSYLGVVAFTAYALAMRLRLGVLGYSTELHKRTEAAMQTAVERVQRERLEELNRLKRDFIAVLSHELRTPLTPLRTSLELLQAELDEPDSREMLGIALEASGRLQRLVQDYTRLAEVLTLQDHGLSLWNVRIEDLLSAVLDGSRSRLFVVEADPNLTVTTNPRLLGGAILALVRRAELVTPPETAITICCRADGDHVVMTIHDPESYVDPATLTLDDPFARSSERTFYSTNTGLELILAKHSLSRVGGRVRVDSARENGTSVHCTIPAARSTGRWLSGREVREEMRMQA